MKFDETKDREYKLPCKNCENETFHKVLASVSFEESDKYTWLWKGYEIVNCQGCREISFRSDWLFSEDQIHDPETGESMPANHVEIFPNRVVGRKEMKDFNLLPKKLIEIYKETHIAMTNKAPILSGVGIRALTEAICKEKKAKGKDLEQRIDNLVVLKILTEEGAEILHSTRIMGNKAVHELVASNQENLEVAMSLVEHLLLGVYILPKKAKTLPKRKK